MNCSKDIRDFLSSQIIKYLICSLVATIIDVFIVWYLKKIGINIVIANTIGVIVGFIVSYILSIKKVFTIEHSKRSFLVFFATFLLGLFLADAIIAIVYYSTENILSENLQFLFSKGASIAFPFFIMYFIRKRFLK